MGTFFREIDQSSVDMEDLILMLKKEPNVIEGTEEYNFNGGEITF